MGQVLPRHPYLSKKAGDELLEPRVSLRQSLQNQLRHVWHSERNLPRLQLQLQVPSGYQHQDREALQGKAIMHT